MQWKEDWTLTETQRRQYEVLYAGYRKMHEEPGRAEPLFIINTPLKLPTWEDRLSDPLVMLAAELEQVRAHASLGDDRVPTVRVQFGTAQIAAAFGCDMFLPTDNLPCAGSHVLKAAEDVHTLPMPSLTAGWFGKLQAWTEVYRQHLPNGIHIQLPDIQSAFNSSHLIRGNDILTDLYDEPAAVEALLDKVTDYMIALVPWLREMITNDHEWFFDWGAMWKGSARISNCSMHMISPRMYVDHVYPRDVRLLEAIGGGRIHYCGTQEPVMEAFMCGNPAITGLDFDGNLHDLWHLSELAPERMVLLQWGETEKTVSRLLQGDWPEKRNVVFVFDMPSGEEARKLLDKLRDMRSRVY